MSIHSFAESIIKQVVTRTFEKLNRMMIWGLNVPKAAANNLYGAASGQRGGKP